MELVEGRPLTDEIRPQGMNLKRFFELAFTMTYFIPAGGLQPAPSGRSRLKRPRSISVATSQSLMRREAAWQTSTFTRPDAPQDGRGLLFRRQGNRVARRATVGTAGP